MAERDSGATPWLAFLLGALLVLVAVIAWTVYSGGLVSSRKVDITVEVPKPSLPGTPTPPSSPVPSTPVK